MTKALFFDIDGTLVSFRTHRIPDSALKAIAAAKERGIRVFIATGRSQAEALMKSISQLRERELIDGYVTMNGAYCFVGDKVIHHNALPADEARRALEYCAETGVACSVVDERDIFIVQPNDLVRQIFNEYLNVEVLPVIRIDEALRLRDVYQLSPFVTEEQEDKLRACVPHCEISRWHPAFVDITALGNTKQLGIDLICKHFDIDVAEAMAFGDGGNDIPMLRHAGIGIAMGNANDTVKAAADYVTTSVDENGIAHALQHFGLI